MPNKLKAKKTVVDGKMFDSKREANRYVLLRQMEENGEIEDLQCQVKFPLLPAKRNADGYLERAVYYIADFVYVMNGEKVVEDVKGFRKANAASYAKFVLKRKLMLHLLGITVKEV